MIKKTLSIMIALLMVLSSFSFTLRSVSAEAFAGTASTADEATKDEAELVVSDEPKADPSLVNGTVIGYIGDANLDDKINVKDATSVQKHLAKLISLNEKAKLIADADNNQKLNVRDATTIQKYIAGISVNSKIWHLIYETGTHTHNYIEAVVEATCDKDGYISYSCICGDEYKENEVPAKGHDYTIKRVDATCIKDGYTLFKCNNCNHSYKDNETKATGIHLFEKGICKHCGLRESAPYIEKVKNFVIENGVYDKELKSYSYYLSTGHEYDMAAIVCTKDDDAIAIAYGVYFEDGIDIMSIGISPEEDEFTFYMICSGIFESVGSYSASYFTKNVKNVSDMEYYFYVDGVTEADALEYTLDYVYEALNVYDRNFADLPATIREIGFKNFR